MAIAHASLWHPNLRLSTQSAKNAAIMAATCLILINVLLHAQVYDNRNYREDEIVVVHLSLLFSPSKLVQYLAADTHPPGWQLTANAWIEAFGISEDITRWLSKLINLITFALIYQLGKHICGRRVGLYAIVLLGVYGFASSAMNELRPYPMLIMLTTALHLLFYRWLHKPTSVLMLTYTFVGIAAIYTHFFSFFVFPAHAVCMLLITRFDRNLWLNSFIMWAFIGTSFLGWLLPFLQAITVVVPGGIYYAIPPGWEGLRLYYNGSKFEPEIIYQLLMLLSPFAPSISRRFSAANTPLRFERRYTLLYPLILLIMTVFIAYAADSLVRNFSQRNVVMFAPLIAACMALSLRLLPTIAALALLSLLILHAPQSIEVQTSNAPYREIVQVMKTSYETNSIVVTEFNWAWRWLLGAAYYLMDFTPDKMPKERIFHLVEPRDSAHPPHYPDELVNIYHRFHHEVFANRLPEHQQLWHLQEGGGNELGVELRDWLNRNYAHIRTVSWDEEYETSYSLSEYARVPAHDGPILDVGESLHLFAWERHESIDSAPCQTVTIESWWQIQTPDSTPYTISIILADSDGDGQLAIENSVPADQFTSDWVPNRFYRDRTSIAIPCDIGSGNYDLLLAAKESMSGEPLLLAYPGREAFGKEHYLTTLVVANS
ncbi:MAG: glycosyltransferase family 39 protein [Chloroflexi bacterium]|nr:glycosyltransferase family 39 protein [Chloroflexota bacterium]